MNIRTLKIVLAFTGIVTLEFCALYSAKKASLGERFYLGISMLCYGLIPILLLSILLNNANISTVNISWNLCSTIYGILIGVVIFSEKIEHLQWYGIAMGTLSLVLIYWGQKEER